jgi:sugar (pentulose or hexulose) kinase
VDPMLNTVFAAVGMRATIDKLRKTSQLLWYQACDAENWHKAHKFLLISTYLNYRLTGEFADSDASVVGHIPYNYKERNWDKPGGVKSKIFPADRSKLFEIRPSCSVIGRLTETAAKELHLPAGLPVAGAGSDKACETLGVGCTDNTCGSISLGSQATIETTASRYYEIEPFFTPFAAVKQKMLSPEFTLYRGFWLVTWFEEQFASEETVEAKAMGIDPLQLLNKRLQNVPVGCEGLVLQPFWGQELTRPDARGCMIGFSDKHTRIHIYRAIIEGIAYAMLDGIHRIEKVGGVRMKKLALSGGGSQSDEICQIAANIFGRDVYRVQTYETSGLGAAIAAFCALGVYADVDTAVEAMVHPTDFFKPQKKDSDIYAQYYENVYKKIYNQLKPLYKTISEIEKKAAQI